MTTKSNEARARAEASFRKEVDGVSHVVNFDLPKVPETYVHRIGRTARGGAEGIAISLCDGEEVAFLRDIEKLIRMTIPMSDRRADQRGAEPPPAKHASTRSSVDAKPRHWHRDGASRKQSRHSQPTETPRGIDSVAFIHRNGSPGRDRALPARHWAGHSKGT